MALNVYVGILTDIAYRSYLASDASSGVTCVTLPMSSSVWLMTHFEALMSHDTFVGCAVMGEPIADWLVAVTNTGNSVATIRHIWKDEYKTIVHA